MQRNNDRSLIAQHTNRRRVIIALGSTAVGGGILARTFSDPVAAVSVDTLDVQDAEFDAEAVTPALEATVAYEYDVESATNVRVWIAVDGDEVSETELYTSSADTSNDVDMTAPVTDADGFGASDFKTAPGEDLSVTVPVTVGVEVSDGDRVIADATASDSAEVVVRNPDDASSASVGGVVTVVDSS
jgi:uncharacterized protein YabE (DUF348 family)